MNACILKLMAVSLRGWCFSDRNLTFLCVPSPHALSASICREGFFFVRLPFFVFPIFSLVSHSVPDR